MNREQKVADELQAHIKAHLPEFTLLKKFEIQKWESYSPRPYIYIFDPSQVSEDIEGYEDGAGDYDIKTTITAYICYQCKNDIAGSGLFEVEYRERTSQVEKALRNFRATDYSDDTEFVSYQPATFSAKFEMNANKDYNVGLAMVVFELKGKVVLE